MTVQLELLRSFGQNMRRAVALSIQIFRRTIGAKYRKSFLGYFWMVVPAVIISGGVSLANLAGAINPGVTGLPYPLFVFVGVILWLIFAELLDIPYQAFDGARSYLTRVNFPREAIVLVQTYEALIGAAARFLFLCVVIAAYGMFSFTGALLLLLCIATAILLGLGLGMLLAPFMILFEDLRSTVRLVASYGIFVSPAFYVPHKGLFGDLIQLNPASPIMAAARESIATGELTSAALGFFVVLVLALILLLCGVFLIRLASPIVIERMLLGGR